MDRFKTTINPSYWILYFEPAFRCQLYVSLMMIRLYAVILLFITDKIGLSCFPILEKNIIPTQWGDMFSLFGKIRILIFLPE